MACGAEALGLAHRPIRRNVTAYGAKSAWVRLLGHTMRTSTAERPRSMAFGGLAETPIRRPSVATCGSTEDAPSTDAGTVIVMLVSP